SDERVYGKHPDRKANKCCHRRTDDRTEHELPWVMPDCGAGIHVRVGMVNRMQSPEQERSMLKAMQQVGVQVEYDDARQQHDPIAADTAESGEEAREAAGLQVGFNDCGRG